MYKTVVKNINDLTGKERKICASMSFKENGRMLGWLQYPYVNAQVVLAYDGDLMVGWGVRNPSGESGFWTRRKYRRKGVGSTMVQRLAKEGTLRVRPYNQATEAFFEKNKQYERFL